MKKLFLLLVMSAVVSGAVMAQQTQQPQQPQPQQKDAKHAEWDKKVKDELKLTSDQLQKYDALSKEYSDKFDALEKDASLTPEAQKERKMELKKEKQTRLAEFLTPEQQTKYQELMDKKKSGS